MTKTPTEAMLATVSEPCADAYAFQVGYLTSFLDSLAKRFPDVAEAIAERTQQNAPRA